MDTLVVEPARHYAGFESEVKLPWPAAVRARTGQELASRDNVERAPRQALRAAPRGTARAATVEAIGAVDHCCCQALGAATVRRRPSRGNEALEELVIAQTGNDAQGVYAHPRSARARPRRS